VTSHDLREPLRAIENFSRIVNDRYCARLDDKGQDFLRRIISGAQRLNRLLDDILTLSRSQRIGVPSEEVDGESIVTEALKRLEGKINTTGARIHVAQNFHGLRVDKTWATHAVYNLIANALKFTREGEAPDVEVVPLSVAGAGPECDRYRSARSWPWDCAGACRAHISTVSTSRRARDRGDRRRACYR